MDSWFIEFEQYLRVAWSIGLCSFDLLNTVVFFGYLRKKILYLMISGKDYILRKDLVLEVMTEGLMGWKVKIGFTK